MSGRGNLELTDAAEEEEEDKEEEEEAEEEEDGHHLPLLPQRNRVKEFSFGIANHQISPLSLPASEFYISEAGSRFIQSFYTGFLALPDPMNRVLPLIYPKHQISPLL